MYPGLVSCPFYAIPIYPLKFMKFFFYLLVFTTAGAGSRNFERWFKRVRKILTF